MLLPNKIIRRYLLLVKLLLTKTNEKYLNMIMATDSIRSAKP